MPATYDLLPPIELTPSARIAVAKNRELTDQRLRLLALHEVMRVCEATGRDADAIDDWMIYHAFAVGAQEFICTPQNGRLLLDTCTRTISVPLDPNRFGDALASVPIPDTEKEDDRREAPWDDDTDDNE